MEDKAKSAPIDKPELTKKLTEEEMTRIFGRKPKKGTNPPTINERKKFLSKADLEKIFGKKFVSKMRKKNSRRYRLFIRYGDRLPGSLRDNKLTKEFVERCLRRSGGKVDGTDQLIKISMCETFHSFKYGGAACWLPGLQQNAFLVIKQN